MKKNLPKISFAFLLFVVASLPTFRSFTPIFIVLFAISTLAHGFMNKQFLFSNKTIVLTGVKFFLNPSCFRFL